ncbi:hypothetical protein CIW51_01110 [Mycolicibacterium sp. P9-22]|nr:hypothetical protein CIW51_01110 [Mycolicibacterium sp. P9-22]
MTSLAGEVPDPLTPEQSKTQVVDAARDIVRALQLEMTRVVFWRASCNDQHEAPFRSVVSIWYPPAPTLQASDAEVAEMIRRLHTDGWTPATDFKTHGAAVTKHDVVAVLAPQAVGDKHRGIDLYGECRDVTTTKATAGSTEEITLD